MSAASRAGPSGPSTPSLPPSAFQTPEHRRVLTAEAILTTPSSARGRPSLLTPPPGANRGLNQTQNQIPGSPGSAAGAAGAGAGAAGGLGHSPTSTKHLVLEQVLASHASAPDPALAALEQVIADRNALAGQNAQLWKLIERQRVMQKSLERDCERLRGERDRATGRERERDREREREREREKDRGKRRDTSEERPRPDRPGTTRMPSEDSVSRSSRTPAVPGSSSNAARSAPASVSPSASASSTSLASAPAPASTSMPTPPSTTEPLPPALTSAPALPISTHTHTFAPSAHSPSPSPSTPTRTHSVPVPSPLQPPAPIVSASAQSAAQAAWLQQQQQQQQQQRQHPPRAQSQPVHTNGYTAEYSAAPPAPPASAPPPAFTPAAAAAAPQTPPRDPPPLSPDSSAEGQALFLPSSAISPSPAGPGPAPQSPKRQPLGLGTTINVVPPTPAPASASASASAQQQQYARASEDVPPMPVPVPMGAGARGGGGMDGGTGQGPGPGPTMPLRRREKSPSPGPLSPVSIRGPVLQQQQQQQLYLTPADLPLTTVHISHSTIRANDRGKDVLSFHISVSPPPFPTPSSRDLPMQQQQQQQQLPQGASPSPSSSVSELGIGPPPGPGAGFGFGVGGSGGHRQPWAIEKLYSDILALDTKVRGGLSRSMSKKLGSLPEGKAFRDHAPVKSDQRKAALTAYLQALLVFPLSLETRRVVCRFFTSDVGRGRAVSAGGGVGGGVGREGYKEGYLTKRGKNFGGWKTRYFVLGGRMLEYYESRGGAHLGSIQLVGAKIGRQQRATSGFPSSSSSSLSLARDRDQTSSVASTASAGGGGGGGGAGGGGPTDRDADDENAYRHAFLIIEQREKGPVKHVLCAESDAERDGWVEYLVRYVNPLPAEAGAGEGMEQDARQSSDSLVRNRIRSMSKDDIARPAQAVPIAYLVPDAENAKLFRAAPPPPSPGPPGALQPALGGGLPDSPRLLSISASMPNAMDLQATPRSNSSMGSYPDTHRTGLAAPPEQRVHSLGTAAAARLTASGALLTPAKPRDGGAGALTPSSSSRTITASGSSSTLLAEPQGAASDRDRKAKSGRFWGFGRSHAEPKAGSGGGPGQPGGVGGGQSVPSPHAVFGVPLQDSLNVASIANLPAVVFRCIEYLEARGAEKEEGIYRLSGSSAVVKALRERFNVEGDVDLLKSDEYWDLHAVAGLLKGFLRELPTSVLTRELHLRFLAVIDLLDAEERIAELASLIAALPLPNYSLLRALTAHLILIVQHSAENKMNMRNVGIVFSPTLGIPAGVFSLMLAEFNHVFNVGGEDAPDADGEGEGEEVPGPESVEDVDVPEIVEGEEFEFIPKRASNGTGTPGSRNSRSYADGAADRLLGFTGRSLKPSQSDLEETSDSDNVIHEESGTETEDAELDGLSIQDSRSASGHSTGTGEDLTLPHSIPSAATAAQMYADVHGTPTQAQTQQNGNVIANANGSRAKMVASARGLQLAPGVQAGMGVGKAGLPLSPRPPQAMSPRQ